MRRSGERTAAAMPAPRRARQAAVGMLVAVSIVALSSCAIAPRPEVPMFDPPAPGAALPAIDIDAPGRSADQLADWAAPLAAELGISQTALEAYGYGAAVMAASAPGCGIGWTTIAGIGSVESAHGTYAGASVGADGLVSPPIRGIPLDGRPGVATIEDTDGGRQDGDEVFDRAMGPTQFIPETWVRWGVDANGDGLIDPDNIDDAALTTARYLCASAETLATAQGWSRSLLTYNMSTQYALDVQYRANAYAAGLRP